MVQGFFGERGRRRGVQLIASRCGSGAGAALLAACALGALAPSAIATYPGRNGTLAAELHGFDRGGGLSWEILVMDPASGRVRRHVSPCSRPEGGYNPDYPEFSRGSCPHDPSFSADGQRLAFERDGRLAVARADGSQVTTLPSLTERDLDPHWSPDGSQLVFTGRRGGQSNVFLVHPSGAGLRQLTTSGGRAPAWSRDGRIAYVSSGQIHVLDPRGGGPTRLARGDHPDWASSGRSLAYEARGGAFRIVARAGARRKLLRRRARRPVFSPDGRRLAFTLSVRGDAPGSRSLYVARATGRRAKRIGRGGEQPEGSAWDAYLSTAWRPLR